MNRFFILVTLVLASVMCSCSDGYDAAVCQDLSDKILREKSLTQDDYAEMLDQYESILKYLIDKADEIIDQSDADKKMKLQQQLRNDEEYLRRFGYMFTFGSTLYQAEVQDDLDDDNLARYKNLEKYCDEFAERSEKL